MLIDPRDRVATFAVHPHKLSRYLLDLRHPKGGSKASFFVAYGFVVDRPADLEHALCLHGRQGSLAGVRRDTFGLLFEVDGGAMTPGGRVMHIRSVWTLREAAARTADLVTAFPRRG